MPPSRLRPPPLRRTTRSPNSSRTRFARVRKRNLANNLTVLGSLDIKIGLLPPAAAGARVVPAARQFDFDANVQRGMADRKASAGRFKTRSCPTPCPTTLFEVSCLPREMTKPASQAGLRVCARLDSNQ